jgi:hypothetical protein
VLDAEDAPLLALSGDELQPPGSEQAFHDEWIIVFKNHESTPPAAKAG